jgi:hypothetical protein
MSPRWAGARKLVFAIFPFVRYTLMMGMAWVVIPFLPAANVFFYPGTFVGERLLYMPSIGYCIITAHMFGGEWISISLDGDLLPPPLPPTVSRAITNGSEPSSSKKRKKKERDAAKGTNAGARNQRSAALLLQQEPGGLQEPKIVMPEPLVESWKLNIVRKITVAVLLLCFSSRTYMRNLDWRSQETLFSSAAAVVPGIIILVSQLLLLDIVIRFTIVVVLLLVAGISLLAEYFVLENLY